MATYAANDRRLGAPPGNRSDAVKASPWPYLALLAYLLSFVYVIPYPAPINWAMWPTLTDFALAALVAASFAAGRPRGFETHSTAKRLVVGLVVFLIVGGISYIVVNLGMNSGRQSSRGTQYGAFYLFRLFQYLLAAWAASRIPMSPGRLRGIAWVAGAVLLLGGAICVANRLDLIPSSVLAPQIPAGKTVSGPWSGYADNALHGNGTLGYNHALTASILLAMLALCVTMPIKSNALIAGLLILYGILAVAASGSRAGLAVIVVYGMILYLRNPIYVAGAVAVGALLFLIVPTDALQGDDVEAAVEKQSELANPLESRQFQDRQRIWQNWSEELFREPRYLVTGVGLGAASDVAGLAHNLPLTVLGEFGLFGLLTALLAAGWLLRTTWKIETPPRRFTWFVAGVLLSCLTQETLYPVPAMGHFPGLFCVAMVLFAGRVQYLARQSAPTPAWTDVRRPAPPGTYPSAALVQLGIPSAS